MKCFPKLFIGYKYQIEDKVFRCFDLIPKYLTSMSQIVYLKDKSIVDRLNNLAKVEGFQEASRISQGIDKGYEPDRVPNTNDYDISLKVLRKNRFTLLNVKLLENFTETTRIALTETLKVSAKKNLICY